MLYCPSVDRRTSLVVITFEYRKVRFNEIGTSGKVRTRLPLLFYATIMCQIPITDSNWSEHAKCLSKLFFVWGRFFNAPQREPHASVNTGNCYIILLLTPLSWRFILRFRPLRLCTIRMRNGKCWRVFLFT